MNAWLLVAWIGCQGLDLGTTTYALHHGFREGNPVMAGHVTMLKVSVNVGMGAVHWRVKDRPVARVIPTLMAASGCAAGALNLHTLAAAAK